MYKFSCKSTHFILYKRIFASQFILKFLIFNVSLQMKLMSHTVFLGLQIAQVVLVGSYLDAYVVDDFQSVGFQSYAFHGVVGNQTHLLYTQQT